MQPFQIFPFFVLNLQEMPSKPIQTGDHSHFLISQCKSGGNKAFKELYLRFAKTMLNICMRIVNNESEAEDILQESFLKAFQNISQFENEASFGSWLKRVVINHSIDTIRKKKNITFVSLDHTLEHPENDESGETGEEVFYEIGSVRDCIQELPDGYRIVITLYLFEEYSHKEIAALLNISEGTSKSQYNRAKKKLVKLIKEKVTIHEP
jgi:RNA polymerase sigma factor (sigma-70 family)